MPALQNAGYCAAVGESTRKKKKPRPKAGAHFSTSITLTTYNPLVKHKISLFFVPPILSRHSAVVPLARQDGQSFALHANFNRVVLFLAVRA